MKTVLTIVIGVALLAGAVAAVKLMGAFRPEAKIVEKERLLQTVVVHEVKRGNVQVELPTQGLVTAARTTQLASEVAGKVAEVSPRFKAGERFQEGDLLVRLEAADYQAALVQAESSLREAEAALVLEVARAEQAGRDWKKLGTGREASELVLRKPQVASAEARVKAAEGAVEKARRDLERTSIMAPFEGRLKATVTEVGSFVMPGSVVAEFASVGTYEVRLPLSVDEVAFLPEAELGAKVKLEMMAGSESLSWEGRVVRTEGEVERASRSIYLVAEVTETGADDLLQPGLFVRAAVQGELLEGVMRVPRSAFTSVDEVLLVVAENRLRFRKVGVVRADGDDLIVSRGLEAGDRVCLTLLAAPLDGMEVRVKAEETAGMEAAAAKAP